MPARWISALVVLVILTLCYELAADEQPNHRFRHQRALIQRKDSWDDNAKDLAFNEARNQSILRYVHDPKICGGEGIGSITSYQTNAGHFPVCVHAKADMISDRVRDKGIWDDCEDLVWFVWNEFSDGPRLKSKTENFEALTVIDVGANIGLCSIRLAKMGHSILGFEPTLINYQLFHRNVQLNNLTSLVTTVNAGISDLHGTAPIIIEQHNAGNAVILSTSSNAAHIADMVRSSANSTFTHSTAVLQPLEPHILAHPQIHLLKLDCQGCEPAALRSAGPALRSGRVATIVFEFSPPHLRAGGHRPEALLHLLHEAGFTLATLVMGTPIPREAFERYAQRYSAGAVQLRATHSTFRAGPPPQRALVSPGMVAAAAGVAAAAWAAVWCVRAGGRGGGRRAPLKEP